eukprot:4956455-Pyramimonas_sp.AAC.1
MIFLRAGLSPPEFQRSGPSIASVMAFGTGAALARRLGPLGLGWRFGSIVSPSTSAICRSRM